MGFEKLIEWYEKNKRDFPFRNTVDPYKIWVSEIMLQQTQVETVIPFFNKFIKKYPEISNLALDSIENVLNTVNGLGYYRRFRLMHKASKIIHKDYSNNFPNKYEDVIKLPGVGEYTAGAIMSFAYNKPYSALDGNVIRVLSRLYEIELDVRLQSTKKKMNLINQKIIQNYNPRLYSNAMMELGSQVCNPNNPQCEICPLSDICRANKSENQIKYPIKSKKKPVKVLYFCTVILKYKNKICLKKVKTKLYEGMYLFPQYEVEDLNSLEEILERKYEYRIIDVKNDIKHKFSHQEWIMKPVLIELLKKPKENLEFIKMNEILKYPIPKAHLKIYDTIKM